MVNVVVVAPLYTPVLVTLVQVEPPLVLSCHWKLVVPEPAVTVGEKLTVAPDAAV